ncbi:MAG: D-alanine--D-alanine ligase [Acidimicrobiales bacterium]|nr:D-alanine--D-alanine ligase [Acidimicrobiales bacterium]
MAADPPDDRINLIVIFGGQSAEHDVSCVTATHVLRAVDQTRYRVTPIGIDREGRWQLATGAVQALAAGPHALPERLEAVGDSVSPTPLLSSAAFAGPVVVMPLLHGPLGEDGTVQGLLELMDVPYVGSGVLGSAVGMDKALAKEVLGFHGIAQARWVSLREHEVSPTRLAEIVAELGLPVFVKPSNMGSSVGVSKATSAEELQASVEHALSYDEWVVIEEAIVGREIEVAVLGNLEPRASLPGEIVPGNDFYDYEDKYLVDGAELRIPAPLTEDQTETVRALAISVYQALRCEGLARVDFFFEEHGRGFLINEVNTMPGFTPISMYPKMWQQTGMTYPELVDNLIDLAVERHHRRRRNTKH